jgi:hypothetical protein
MDFVVQGKTNMLKVFEDLRFIGQLREKIDKVKPALVLQVI